MEKRYIYNPENHHVSHVTSVRMNLGPVVISAIPVQIMTSVCWLGNGKNFATSYSDGSIAVWYAKIDNRPEKIFFLHGKDEYLYEVQRRGLVHSSNLRAL